MKTLSLIPFALLLASTAPAQPRQYRPYSVSNGFTQRCTWNAYTQQTACDEDPLLTSPGVLLAISEGIVGDTGHELGYIILSNPTLKAQDTIVEVMLRGDNTTTYIKRLHLERLSSVSVDLPADPIFQCATRIFNTFVYFEDTGTAELKIYDHRDPERPLAYVATDKDGLPLPKSTAAKP